MAWTFTGFRNRTHLPSLLIQRRRTAMRHPSASTERGSAHRGTRARHSRRIIRQKRGRPTTRRTITLRLRGAQSGGGPDTCCSGILEGTVLGLYYTLLTSTVSSCDSRLGPRYTSVKTEARAKMGSPQVVDYAVWPDLWLSNTPSANAPTFLTSLSFT
ncbi:hypothetical protein EDB85DRAFT_1997930, partial [Lactarius pseudohatsudake]